MSMQKEAARDKRRGSIRKRVSGSTERPRLAIFRSLKHIYAQVIDDSVGKTLVSTGSVGEKIAAEVKGMKKKDQAKHVGKTIAKLCLEKGIEKVVFDRGGYLYHGRVTALAEGAREAGLKF
jgi:large subunit ribosomal protein L18